MTYANDILKADSGLIARLSAAFTDYMAARKIEADKHRVYRKTLNELNSLSRRDLDDIGIGHGNIETIARQAAYGA